MFDISWSEMAIIALLALVVIGPKDLPRVLRTMGQFMRKARALSREFQSGLNDVMREAELAELESAPCARVVVRGCSCLLGPRRGNV